jgi:hypothetical protein
MAWQVKPAASTNFEQKSNAMATHNRIGFVPVTQSGKLAGLAERKPRHATLSSTRKTTMLVTFSSKAGADILMLSQHAKPLLQIVGKLDDSGLAMRGVFMPEHLAHTISQLEQAIAHSPDPADVDEDEEFVRDPISRPVGLRQRAFPLLDLLKRAKEKGLPVLWEASSPW